MAAINKIFTSIGRFLRRDEGAISVEAAIILPLLGIAYVVGFAYFDTYRREAILTKATYTVSDVLSRETGVVSPAYLEGMQDIFEFLTFSEGRSWMRFTEIERSGDDLVIHWTYATDGNPDMTQARLDSIRSRIPRLNDGEFIVVTESYTTHTPVFDVGLLAREFPRVAPTRTRHIAQLAWDGSVMPSEEPAETPFDTSTLVAPTIPLFDTLAASYAPPASDTPDDTASSFSSDQGSTPSQDQDTGYQADTGGQSSGNSAADALAALISGIIALFS